MVPPRTMASLPSPSRTLTTRSMVPKHARLSSTLHPKTHHATSPLTYTGAKLVPSSRSNLRTHMKLCSQLDHLLMLPRLLTRSVRSQSLSLLHTCTSLHHHQSTLYHHTTINPHHHQHTCTSPHLHLFTYTSPHHHQ